MSTHTRPPAGSTVEATVAGAGNLAPETGPTAATMENHREPAPRPGSLPGSPFELPPELLLGEPSTADARPKLRTWRDVAISKYSRVVTDAAVLLESGGVTSPKLFDTLVVNALKSARQVIEGGSRPHGIGSLKRWLLGTDIENVWLYLHQAEDGLLLTMDQAHLKDVAPNVLEAAKGVAGVDQAKIRQLEDMVRKVGQKEDIDSDELRRVAVDVQRCRYLSTDAEHQHARKFRNRVMATSAVLILLAVALVVWQAVAGFRLFNQPSAAAGLGPNEALVLIMVFGCIGALFTAIPSLATQPSSESPFNIPAQQAILKVSIGAWSAVVGLLAVTSGMVAGNSGAALASVGSLAMMAAVFGAGQEAVSRFADRSARGILEKT